MADDDTQKEHTPPQTFLPASALSAPPLSATFGPSIRISHTPQKGNHFTTTETIQAKSVIATTPLSSTFSILNIAQIAPHWPISILNSYCDNPEILTRALLCEAWRLGNTKWQPYIESVPGPNDFDIPLCWDKADRDFLRGTNLLGATEKREEMWAEEFRVFSDRAKDCAGADVEFGLERYKWAAMVLSSRSFAQGVLGAWKGPEESGGSFFDQSELGRRWRERAGDWQLPVLLPGIDIANHDPNAKAKWTAGNNEVVFSREDEIPAGGEVCNNYGRKGNEELLLGYGFMLEENDADFVLLSTASADQSQDASQGTRLHMPSQEDQERPDLLIQRSIRPADVVRLASQLSNPRELGQVHSESPGSAIVLPPDTRKFSLIVDAVILGLENRRERLVQSKQSAKPANQRQKMAVDYCQYQMHILEANSTILGDYLLSLPAKGRLLTLGKLLSEKSFPRISTPLLSLLSGILESKPRVKAIRAAGYHELAFVLWICSVWLMWDSQFLSEDTGLYLWMRLMQRSCNIAATNEKESSSILDQETSQIVDSYLTVIKDVACCDEQGLYADPRWTRHLIAAGLEIWRQESVVFKSLNRMVRNGLEEEHEDMLYLEY